MNAVIDCIGWGGGPYYASIYLVFERFTEKHQFFFRNVFKEFISVHRLSVNDFYTVKMSVCQDLQIFTFFYAPETSTLESRDHNKLKV